MTASYHLLAATGPKLAQKSDIDAFLSEAFSANANWLAIPTEHFDEAFFDLSSRLLGTTAQKFRNYGVGIAVVGDSRAHASESRSLADFVRETNQGRAFWFVRDEEELKGRLAELI